MEAPVPLEMKQLPAISQHHATELRNRGFCVVKGSHKLNFAVPADVASGDDADFASEHASQVPTQAGDVVFFSEATVHGALPWTMPYERRLALMHHLALILHLLVHGRAHCHLHCLRVLPPECFRRHFFFTLHCHW